MGVASKLKTVKMLYFERESQVDALEKDKGELKAKISTLTSELSKIAVEKIEAEKNAERDGYNEFESDQPISNPTNLFQILSDV